MLHSLSHLVISLIQLISLPQAQAQMPNPLGIPSHSVLKVKSQVTWRQSATPLEKQELFSPSCAASCSLHGVTLTSSSNSDRSTVLYETCSFVQTHLILTAPPVAKARPMPQCK